MNFKSHGHSGHGILYFGEALKIGANLAIAKYNERGYKSLGADVKAGGIAGDVVQYGVLTNNPTALKAIKSGSSDINYNNLSDRQVGKIYAEIRDGFLSEMRNSADTADLKRVVDRLSAGTESDVMLDTIKYAALQVMNENPSKYSVSRDDGVKNLDSSYYDGYNNSRGDLYDYDREAVGRGTERGNEESPEVDRGREEKVEGTRRNNEKDDLRGTQEDQTGRGSQERVHVNSGNKDIYFAPSDNYGSTGGIAAEILNGVGIKAVLCNGDIETGTGKVYSEALTMPDGTVYISDKATLPASQIAAHEAVHSYELKESEHYTAYESEVSGNVLWDSDAYTCFADLLNKVHYGDEYDTQSTDFAKLFVREVSAYVNQYVATDIERANERFSGVFKDWQAVVDASRKFNKAIGADFSGSAFFCARNRYIWLFFR